MQVKTALLHPVVQDELARLNPPPAVNPTFIYTCCSMTDVNPDKNWYHIEEIIKELIGLTVLEILPRSFRIKGYARPMEHIDGR